MEYIHSVRRVPVIATACYVLLITPQALLVRWNIMRDLPTFAKAALTLLTGARRKAIQRERPLHGMVSDYIPLML